MSQKVNNKYNKHKSIEEKTDLFAFAKIVWNGRKRILKFILIFIGIGVFVAIFSQREYTASTIIVPATKGKSVGGSLGGLAAIAGINLGGMSTESGISPSLYPQIINSIPFQKELLKTPLTFEGLDSLITYEDYYTNYYTPGLLTLIKKYTIGLPGLFIKTIRGEPKIVAQSQVSGVSQEIQRVTIDENNLIKQLGSQISFSINEEDGYVSLSVSMPEALSAAEMTYKAQQLLQEYIINFKVQKSSEQLKFIKDRYVEKEKEFKNSQQKLASFQDENQFMNSYLAKINLMVLQTNNDLAFSIYSELAKKLETQQIQVKEDTPVFTIIKPVSLPIRKSKPNRPFILFVSAFIGLVTGLSVVFGKLFFKELKEKWNEEQVV